MRRRRFSLISWNVNGIRSASRKGFLDWLDAQRPDVVGLQETRVLPEELPPALRHPEGYQAQYVAAQKKGYSGVATLSREPPLTVKPGLGRPEFDDEGRLLITETEHCWVYNGYFPKGSGTARDNSRVPYKLAFYDAVLGHALRCHRRTGKGVVVMGDFNTAHQDCDLANPRANRRNSGFLPEERLAYARHLAAGFVDSFRHLHPGRVQYSWWSNRPGVRERNVGWRIDAVWLTPDLLPHLREAFIQDQVRGSDHCPVGVVLQF